MKTVQILTLAVVVDAYVSRSSFVGRPALVTPPSNKAPWTMDTEMDSLDPLARFNLERTLGLSLDLDIAEAKHGMPWKSSIDPKVEDDELLYMPFWEWQMQFMKDNLENLQVVSCSDGKTDFSYNDNTDKKARIVNLCASSSEYRKIRMTYYDAGDNTQVFNSVWYPDPKYNLPVLGIDLLAFNRKKYLAIVDFQPLHEDEADHASTYEHILRPIKEKYDSLKGRMSSKFYDETQFFSQEMLFARFDDEAIVGNDLAPAFQAYVKAHLDLVKSTQPAPQDAAKTLERQKAYDTYSAERDPATGLFTAMFGGEWAGDFVHNFLFSMSERPAGAPAVPQVMPFMGAPPQGKGAPPASQGAPQHAPKVAQPVAVGR
jgi:15,16-dihydrobiliverdin:ferredoxin oxidoreductase